MAIYPPHPRDPAVFGVVQDAFAEALGLDLEEVEYESKIIDDLGAESLDLLDIVFRLERSFDIKIPRGGIESAAKEIVTNMSAPIPNAFQVSDLWNTPKSACSMSPMVSNYMMPHLNMMG